MPASKRLDLAVMNAGDYRPMSLRGFDVESFHNLCAINGLAAVLPVCGHSGPGRYS